jgi:hypothetical protein
MYLIDRPEPSQTLVKARQIAGAQIENLLKINHKSNDPMTYRWIKTDWTYPSFEHFTFAYKNAVFPVFIELIENGNSIMTITEKTRFLNAAKQYNLVPCVFKINVKRDRSSFFKNLFDNNNNDVITPISDGWNLYDLRNGNKIIPENFVTDEKVPMSEWEMRDFAIQICRDEIKKRGWILLSYCNLPEIDPQIWIKDEFNRIGWVIVRTIIKEEDKDYKNWIKKIKDITFIEKYDGYFSGVYSRSMNSFFGIDSTINRGDPITVRFLGFKSVYIG